jgi:hypothetical protein
MNNVGAMFRRATEKQAKDYVLRVAPEKYQEMLIPEWEMACKVRDLYPTKRCLFWRGRAAANI